MSSFEDFMNNTVTVISPKPHRRAIEIDLAVYKKMVSECILKIEKKKLIDKIVGQGEIPVFCETDRKFFMYDIKSKKGKTREVKSREDKLLCGALLNGMIVYEHKNDNHERVKFLQESTYNWDVPKHVLVEQNRHKRN